jgi:transketolase
MRALQSTRQSSQAVLNVIGPATAEILGGSADLTPSNNTIFRGARTITPEDASGNYLHYGVREFGMNGGRYTAGSYRMVQRSLCFAIMLAMQFDSRA